MDYSGSDSILSLSGYWWQAPPLRFRGKHRLTVTRAPDPSQIVWENLEVPWTNRLMRQTLVNLLLLSLLVISFIFIILAQAQQAKFRAQVPQLSTCSVVLPAIAFGVSITSAGTLAPGASLPPGLIMLRDDVNPVCLSNHRERIFWQSSNNAVLQSSPQDPSAAVICLNECVTAASSEICVWHTVDGNITFPTNVHIACYCTQRLFSEISQKGIFTGSTSVYTADGSLCAQVATDYITYNAFAVVASLIVVIMSVLLPTHPSHVHTSPHLKMTGFLLFRLYL